MEQTAITDMESTVDKVVKKVYSRCDRSNRNSVPVLKLIKRIQPFMLDHLTELEDLKMLLDPYCSDPSVSREAFYQAMSIWSAELKEKQSGDTFPEFEPTNPPPIDCHEKPFAVSAPHSADNYHQLMKNCDEVLNASEGVEQETKELENLLREVSFELSNMHHQLSTAEKENGILLSYLKDAAKLLHKERQNVKDEKRKNEELKESNELLQKKQFQLEEQLEQATESFQGTLEQKCELKPQNSAMDDKLESLSTRHQDMKMMNQMREMINIREITISSLFKLTGDLKRQIEHKQLVITYYVHENKRLKHKPDTLAQLEEKLDEQDNLTSDKYLFFNSPRFITEIANTITPALLASPTLPSTNSGHEPGPSTKSDHEPAPAPQSGKVPHNRKVLTCNTSTLNENRVSVPREIIVPVNDDVSCLKRSNSDSVCCPNESNSHPIMFGVDNSDSPERLLRYQCKAFMAEASQLRSLYEHPDAEGEMTRHKLLITVRNAETLIRQLENTLEALSFNLSYEKSLNDELRAENNLEIEKHRETISKLNQLLSKAVDQKQTQTQLPKEEPTKEILLKKYLLHKNQCNFVSQVKESLEKLWNDNVMIVNRAEERVSVIYDKVRNYLSSSISYSFESKNIHVLLNKLDYLEKAINSLLLTKCAESNKSNRGSNIDGENVLSPSGSDVSSFKLAELSNTANKNNPESSKNSQEAWNIEHFSQGEISLEVADIELIRGLQKSEM